MAGHSEVIFGSLYSQGNGSLAVVLLKVEIY